MKRSLVMFTTGLLSFIGLSNNGRTTTLAQQEMREIASSLRSGKILLTDLTETQIRQLGQLPEAERKGLVIGRDNTPCDC